MALDSFILLYNRVLLRVPLATPSLAKDWINDAFRQVAERRRWSWLVSRGQFLFNAEITTGTVSVTFNSNSVTGSGTGWTGVELGRQFRCGIQNPIYTITAVDVGGQILTLDGTFGGTTASAQGYEIYNAYMPVPTNFHQLISCWDPKYNWQLSLDVSQNTLNTWDAQRANQASSAFCVSFFDYITPIGEAATVPPVPRYELWPHIKSQYVMPFLYETRWTDLESGGVLPRYIRGDVLKEMALANAARWPGPGEDKKSPYFNLNLAAMHEARAERMINMLEVQDDEVWEQDIWYSCANLPFMPWDSAWLQSHSLM